MARQHPSPLPDGPALEQLLRSDPRLWKGRRPNASQPVLPTGHARLDARLPGKGWPLGAVTELITARSGLGEFSLLLPALTRTMQQGQWAILVDPPWIPYPGSLRGQGLELERLLLVRTRNQKESLWACEQALRNGRGGAVMAWPQALPFGRLRRLQLAAESSGKLAFLFRPQAAAEHTSPAALRLQLRSGLNPDGLHATRIDILKCRGQRPTEPVWLTRKQHGHEFLTPISGAQTAALAARSFSPYEKPLWQIEGHASSGKNHH